MSSYKNKPPRIDEKMEPNLKLYRRIVSLGLCLSGLNCFAGSLCMYIDWKRFDADAADPDTLYLAKMLLALGIWPLLIGADRFFSDPHINKGVLTLGQAIVSFLVLCAVSIYIFVITNKVVILILLCIEIALWVLLVTKFRKKWYRQKA